MSASGDVGSAPAGLPEWARTLYERASLITARELSAYLPPEDGTGRRSAVLILLGEDDDGQPDMLLIERSHDLRSHAGQPAFPGGAVDPEDDSPTAAAIREAQEETGVKPEGIEVLVTLPDLWLPPTGFIVTPVLAWWRDPCPVMVLDPGEVAAVHRVPIAHLVDPANRVSVVHPSGYRGPGFLIEGMLVWGFTAGLIARLLHMAGWERPWDESREVPFDLGVGRA